jgi:hypothetical protein
MTALISDSKYQAKLDEYWKEAVALGDENYFNQSLKLLNGLLVSGNMPNLSAPTSSTSVAKKKALVQSSLKLNGRVLEMNLSGKARVDLMSVSGQIVKNLWNGNADAPVSVSLENLPSGLYVARVQGASSTSIHKIHLK